MMPTQALEAAQKMLKQALEAAAQEMLDRVRETVPAMAAAYHLSKALDPFERDDEDE